MILRRSVPANRERLALLDQFEKEAGSSPPSLEKVIEAFVAPTLRMSRDPQSGGIVFMKLLGRLHAEGDVLPRILTSQFGDVFQRFGAALRRCAAGLAAGRVVLAPESGRRRPGADPAGWTEGSWNHLGFSFRFRQDSETVLERLVAFLSAGFRAPVPTHADLKKLMSAVQER